jgi:N-acetylmuramoyl-L-alanine amidase
MHRLNPFIFFLIIAFTAPSFAAQKNVEQSYQEARRHYYALFSSPKKMKERAQWLRVISTFNVIAKNRPKSKRGADAQYTIGLLYKNLYHKSKQKKDKKEAIASFGRVISDYPDSTLVDDAERHIGDIRFRDSEYKKAEKAYRSASKRAALKKSKTKTVRKGAKKRSSSIFAQLNEIRRFSQSGYTRMVLSLSKRTAYRAVRLHNPERVFIDILGSKPSPSLNKVTKYKSGMVRSSRLGVNSGNVTRVVFDLATDARHSVIALNNPFRIVIDFDSKQKRAKARKPVRRKKTDPRKFVSNLDYSRIKIIVIDPGHGGKDSGAVGPTGLKEKDVALAISKKLRTALKKKCKCKVYLTRNNDRFIELDDRTVFANSLNADLFISVHLNSHRNRRARGIETYFLSPARSKDEMETAARENMIANRSSNPVENDLAYIMSDMASTQKINDSVTLAKSIQRHMIKGLRRTHSGIKDKGVKQAMFYVLWRATMPSILVETGFISNRVEERRFKTRAFQTAIAESIARGVSAYSRTYQTAMRK